MWNTKHTHSINIEYIKTPTRSFPLQITYNRDNHTGVCIYVRTDQ